MRTSVLIVTAKFEELYALLELDEDLDWREERDPDGFRYHYTILVTNSGRKLRVAAAWAGEMGEVAVADRARSLISHLNPECLAMCGICAGRRGDVFLGDVIVANRVFSYDHGKIIASIDDERVRKEQMFHDITTYNLKRSWAMDARYLSTDYTLLPKARLERPITIEYQRKWLLDAIYQYEQYQSDHPIDRSDRKDACPDWSHVLGQLAEQEFVTLREYPPKLLAKGNEAAIRERALNPEGVPEDQGFKIHVGPIGTGKTVRKDPEIFDRIARYERNVLGLEMEAAGIGYVAEQSDIPSIIVKAVSDYADGKKDDSFHDFAATVSADFLLTFLKKHELRDRPGLAGPARLRDALPSPNQMFGLLCEVGYSEQGPDRIERDVRAQGEDSRGDEFADFVLFTQNRRILAVTIHANEAGISRGLLVASALGTPFYLGVDALQTRLVRLDQPDQPIATVPTSRFVNDVSIRSRTVSPNSLFYGYLPADHGESFETPPSGSSMPESLETQGLRISEFFRGYSDSWIPIQLGVPVDIEVVIDHHRVSITSVKRLLETSEDFCFLKIFGPGGSGKTTMIRRLAFELGGGQHVVQYRLPNVLRISSGDLLSSARALGKQDRKLFLFWDSPTLLGQTSDLVEVLHRLQFERNVAIVVADREDEWIPGARKFSSFRGERVARIQERLNDQQAEALFARISELEGEGLSLLSKGRTLEQFKKDLTSDKSKILLSSVYEATTGERFERILISEFDGIPDEDARSLYRYLCGLFNYAVPVPEALLRCMYGRVRSRTLRREALAGILYLRQGRIWPRHRTIAELLWRVLNPDAAAEMDVFHDLLKYLRFQVEETEVGEKLKQFSHDFFRLAVRPFRDPGLAREARDSLGELVRSPALQVEVGTFFASLGCLDDAIATYQMGVERTPNAVFFKLLGRARLAAGETAAAIAIFEKGLQRFPNPDLFLAHGKAYLQIGDLEKARAIFEEGLLRTPNPSLFEALGRSYLETGELGKALALFEDGLEKTPNSNLFEALGRVYLEIGETEKGIATLEEGILRTANPQLFAVLGKAYLETGDVDKAISIFEEGLEKAPNPILFEELGAVYLEVGEVEKAIATLEEGLEEISNPQLFCGLGLAYLGIGEVDKAIATLEEGLEHAPNVNLFVALGRTYLEMGKTEEGLAVFEDAVEKEPHPQLFHVLGTTYWQIGEPGKAIATYERGLKKTPDPLLFNRLGGTYRELGDVDKAISIYEDGLSKVPHAMLYDGLGAAYLEIGETGKAIATFERGLERSPNLELFLGLGKIYLEVGEADRATATFAEGLEKTPHPHLFEGIGRAYFNFGEVEKAVATFEAGLERYRNPNLCMALGKTYLEIGEKQQAINVLTAGLERGPNSNLFVTLGGAYQTSGKIAEAIEIFARGLEKFPNPNMFTALGRAYLESGESEKAIATFKQGLARFRNAHFFSVLGKAYLESGQREVAARTFEEGLKKAETPDLLYGLGQAYLELGETEKANAMNARADELMEDVDEAL